ncbi:MAG: hypothetical protein KGJ86_03115 [Chloroflexota bacterium]|nr:hypothetical protein [Chloroflexota bacterium]
MSALAETLAQPGPPGAIRARQLQAAVRKSLIYSDLFDFPLTTGELCAYLFDVGADEEEILQAARSCDDVVELDGRFCLAGRQQLVAERRRRQADSERLWARARHYASVVAALPFVRMVAITGSLAPGNARAGDDIDLLLVVAQNRLWLCRLLVLALVKLSRLFGDELCPNFLLAESRLEIDGSAFPAYYARELSHMVPLFGGRAYRDLRLANGWTVQLLPNSNHVVRPSLADWPAGLAGVLKRLAEAGLSLRAFDWLEALERRRKVARLLARHAREQGIVELSADRCRGHFGSYIDRMMALFDLRCAALTRDDVA